MTDPRRRIQSVVRRGASILRVLRESGPMSLSDLAVETGFSAHHTRYAANVLVSDEAAHIHHYERVACADGVERQVAFYAAGKGENASPDNRPALDFSSTRFIQDYYMAWLKNPNPPILEPEDELP